MKRIRVAPITTGISLLLFTAMLLSACSVDASTPSEKPSESVALPATPGRPTVSGRPLQGFRGFPMDAVATVYWAEAGQTDDSPLITADGTKIDRAALQRGELRYCAVSRDLLERWGGPIRYGDTVRVTGAGNFSGYWVVHDTMNKRFGVTWPKWDKGVPGVVEPHPLNKVEVDGRHHIDFLVPVGVMGKFDNATITIVLGTVRWGVNQRLPLDTQ